MDQTNFYNLLVVSLCCVDGLSARTTHQELLPRESVRDTANAVMATERQA